MSLEPSFTQGLLSNGAFVLQRASGDRERALPYYEEAMRLDPDNPSYDFQLGLVLGQTAKKEQATIELQRWLVLKELTRPLYSSLPASILQTLDWMRLNPLLERAIEANPEFEKVLTTR